MDGARNLDDGRARRGHHVHRRDDRLVDPALASDACVARAEGGEQCTQEYDKRGGSPRTPEAAEDHLQSIARSRTSDPDQISQFDSTNPVDGRFSS